jgi:ubiquinone/menaquinone biosynthesis C-methylase UbiE
MSGTIGSVSEGRVRNFINLNPIIRFFDPPRVVRDKVGHYICKGQRVADLASNTGYYTLLLAECVGPEGKVYAVDLDPLTIKLVEEKVSKSGFRNIELHNANAADLNFIEDHSIDFVLANGLL